LIRALDISALKVKMVLMKTYALLLALSLAVLPSSAQSNKPAEASNIPTVAFCDLVNNPDVFDGTEVKFRATYLANSKVAAFVDQNCLAKDKRTWAEFDGISIKASAPPEVFEKLEKQILCGKCGDDNDWRETEMLVRGIFHGGDTGHGRLGRYRFMVSVKHVEEIGDTVQTETTRFGPR
jgi:hypothetical protein